jgi:hypothetical protein
MSSNTLFGSNSQYREKATIWRIFSLLPLYAALAGGRVWRWFAVNIPMDLGTGGVFTSDIDIIARLHDFPKSQEWLYRTWEVKVSLLCKDGSARSLKVGKLNRTVTQLRTYREFGAPDVSLLDVYICEAGFMSRNAFPPPVLRSSILKKVSELNRSRFGYQLLPFEHGQDTDGDVGLLAIPNENNPVQTTFNLLPSVADGPRQPFSRLADRINEFFEKCGDRPRKHSDQIVFCKACRQLQLICMKDQYECPACHSDLVAQS